MKKNEIGERSVRVNRFVEGLVQIYNNPSKVQGREKEMNILLTIPLKFSNTNIDWRGT